MTNELRRVAPPEPEPPSVDLSGNLPPGPSNPRPANWPPALPWPPAPVPAPVPPRVFKPIPTVETCVTKSITHRIQSGRYWVDVTEYCYLLNGPARIVFQGGYYWHPPLVQQLEIPA